MGNRTAQIRKAFIRERSGDDDDRDDDAGGVRGDPPMAWCLRGGRAGGSDAVRLKLYLTLLWMSSGRGTWMSSGRGGQKLRVPAYTTTFPATTWAYVLGLEDPEGRGKRRISEALRWLDAKELVRLGARPGSPPLVTLLRDDGTRGEYSIPAEMDASGEREGRYVEIDPAFWTNGWHWALPGPAIAVLLALAEWKSARIGPPPRGRAGSKDEASLRNVWISPSKKREYGISEDTWRKGKAELIRAGLVTVRAGRTPRKLFEAPKKRDLYDLHFERIGSLPGPGG